MDSQLWEAINTIAEKAAGYYIKKIPPGSLLEYGDLYQTGVLGALECINRKVYDSSQGNFESFIYHRVNGAIQDICRRLDHVPRRQRELSRDESNPNDERHRKAVSCVATKVLSLDALLDETGRSTLYDTTPGNSPIPSDTFENQEVLTTIWRAAESLQGRDSAILALFMQGFNLQETAKFFDVGEARICQIRQRIFSHLAKYIPR